MEHRVEIDALSDPDKIVLVCSCGADLSLAKDLPLPNWRFAEICKERAQAHITSTRTPRE